MTTRARIGPRPAAAVLAGLLLAAAGAAAAPPELHDRSWLPEGSLLESREVPAERLTVAAGAHGLAELGRLAFRSPDLLGGNARLSGIACQTCHANGGANADLFLPGLSDRPGSVDTAHRLWNPLADDGVDLALPIPSLQGVAGNAPYGAVARMGSLRDFTRRVIVVEFAGPEPRPALLDALVEYQLALAAPDAPAASTVARGEAPADLPRYLAVLDRALAAEDAALAELVARMIRAALGRMTATGEPGAVDPGAVDPAAVDPGRDPPFAGWARSVAALSRQAEAGRFAAARASLSELSASVGAVLR